LIKECFKGPSAVALSYEDPIAPAKVLIKFSNEHKKFEIKTGVMNGKVIDLNAIKAVSALPSREVLLGQFLSVANAVPTGFVRVLNAVPIKFLNLLQALKEQKEAV
jgi:large subunit ribosomal protein L10